MNNTNTIVTNRQARRDYFIVENFEAGIELKGSEIKSIRKRLANLKDSFARIEKGEADVGIVWATEVVHAKAEGRPLDGIAIAAPLNQQDKVNYAIGIMTNGRNAENAARYLAYLGTDDAQSIYGKYGFIRATTEELTPKSF